MRRFVIVLFIVFLFATVASFIASKGIFWAVVPESITRQQLARVIQIRDFEQFSQEQVERFTDRAESEFGRHSANKPRFDMPWWEQPIHVYFQNKKNRRPSYMENNLTLMSQVRFFQWMYAYKVAGREEKASIMQTAVDDMRYWRQVYFDYLRSMNQPEPTIAELQAEFNNMIDQFKRNALPEEIELINVFAQDIQRSLFAAEIRQTISDWLPW